MTELECLAYKYDTDKGSHGYCPHYERFIGDMRNLPITMIEIGVAAGNSMRMWREWMPKAVIYGFDMNGYTGNSEKDGFRVFNGDQKSQHDLERMAVETGRPNLVIDDASHMAEEQNVSFSYLWPRVLSHGWYVIEDCFGIRNAIDLDTIAQGRYDIEEFHLIAMNGGDVICFIKKR